MADQNPLDLSQLSTEQLEAMQSIMQQRALASSVNPLQGGAPPGPASAPLPLGLSQYGAMNKAVDPATATTLLQPSLLNEFLYGDSSKNDPRMLPYKDDPNSKDASQYRRAKGAIDASKIMGSKIATGGASVATGLPWWLTGVNTALAENPADAATTLAGGALFPAFSKLKVAGKGAGSYEILSRLHALLNGDKQAPVNPLQSAPISDSLPIPSDLVGLGLSGLAGGLQGRVEVPDKPDPFKTAVSRYKDYVARQAELDTAHAQTQEASVNAGQASDQAERRLSSHEAQMNSSAQNAKGAAQRSFQQQQADLRAREKSLSFQVADAKDAAQKAADDTGQFQKTLAGAQQHATGTSAETISDQILVEQKHLDDLRNPEKAPDLVGTHPNSAPIRAELDRLNAINTDKYNAGAKKQVQDAIERNQNALDDLTESNVRNEIDASKNRIRVLQDLRRRVDSGRAPGYPPSPEEITQAQEEAARQTQALGGLQGRQNDAQNALADINQKYRATAVERLQHAATAPGATVADQANVETHQKLLDAAEKAQAAKDAAQRQLANIKTQKAVLTEAAKKGNFDTAPAKSTMDNTVDYLKKFGKGAILPAVGGILGHGHDANSMLSLGPAVGTGLGILGDILAGSQAGQKALGAVNTVMSPNASKLTPALVNQLSHMTKKK